MACLELPASNTMANPSSEHSTPSTSKPTSTSITSPRSLKQLTLFLAGSTFVFFSTLITRRAVARRYIATIPRFYAPSNRPPSETVNGRLEALQALNIATINVASFMMMMVGGTLWAFDISSMDDLRRKVKQGSDVDGSNRTGGDAEEAWEGWLAGTLARKVEKKRREQKEEEERKNDSEVE